MPGGAVVPVTGTTDVSRVEAPVTVRAYLIVAFAAFGGIFFGYDTGWMGGVLNMDYFIKQYTGAEYPDVMFPNVDHLDPRIVDYRKTTFVVAPWQQSLVTSILSAGYVNQSLHQDRPHTKPSTVLSSVPSQLVILPTLSDVVLPSFSDVSSSSSVVFSRLLLLV
jgi:hypothetical protein